MFLARANLDGTGVDRSFISVAEFGEAVRGSFPCGIAVDGAHIYWSGSFGPDGIGRANLDGSGVEPNFIDLDAANFACGIAVGGGNIYWANELADCYGYCSVEVRSIARANLDGSGVEQNFIPLAVVNVFRPACGIAVDGAHVYWSQDSIARANLDGSGVEPNFIDLDSDNICPPAAGWPSTRFRRRRRRPPQTSSASGS